MKVLIAEKQSKKYYYNGRQFVQGISRAMDISNIPEGTVETFIRNLYRHLETLPDRNQVKYYAETI